MSDPQVSTDDYLRAIQYAKDNGHTVNIDFSTLPDGVDSKAIASAMGNGLSEDHNNALSMASENGHTVTQDFSVTHPILDTVEKTAELGGMAAGGIAGAGAGALTSPVTGPVGPVAGSIAGAGLGYGAVKSGAEALNQMMGYTQPKTLGDDVSQTASDVGEGAKTQAVGMAAGTVASKGIDAVKAAYPWITNLISKVPKTVAQMFTQDPELPSKYSGSTKDIESSVKAVQDGLETLHDQASQAYSDAMDKLGLGGPKTADAAAESLSSGGGKSVNPAKIGENWKALQTAWPQLSDSAKLQGLALINEDINANLKWAKAGQSVDPIASRLTPYLETIKTGVKKAMDALPGGQILKDADNQWHEFRQIYNTLQPNLKDTGEATKWLTNVVSDHGTATATPKALLQALDAKLGQPVADTAQKQIASNLLKQPLGTSLVGKMSMVMGLIHPARLATLPMAIGVQSPAVQTKVMQGAMALQGLLKASPQLAPTVTAGLKQADTSQIMPQDSDANDLVANQNR